MCQDDPGVVSYAKRREICYALCSDKIIMMNADKAKSDDLSYCAAHGYPIYEDRVSWSAELGKITSPVLAGVIPVSLLLKISLPQGSSVSVSLVQDGVSSQEYELQGEICGIVKIPTIAKRGDDIYLKVSGSGDAVLQGYALEYREGGEACVWR